MTDHGGAASPRTEAGKRLLANMTASDGWGDATYGVRLRTNPEEWRAVILAIEDEAAGLPPEWVWERRPGDDAECERLGCEDRTHPVQHVRLRAAQEAPAPEGLRDAALDLLAALRSWEQSWQTSGWGYGGVRKAKIALARLATPPTPAEPPRSAYQEGWRDGTLDRLGLAEARPPEGLDALRSAAVEVVRYAAERDAAAMALSDLSKTSGLHIEVGKDEPPEWNAMLAADGFLNRAIAALAARLSAGGDR